MLGQLIIDRKHLGAIIVAGTFVIISVAYLLVESALYRRDELEAVLIFCFVAPALLLPFIASRSAAREKERSDEIIRTKSLHLNLVLDNMAQGICMFDKDKNLIVCNSRYIELYSLPPELMETGTPFRAILEYRVKGGAYAGDDPERYIQERISAVEEDGASIKIQQLIDGRVIAINHKPLEDGGWVATHEDITELAEAQSLNQRLATIVEESINEVYVFDDRSLNFILVNAAACKNLGYSMEELASMSPLDLKPDYSPEQFAALIAPLRSGEKSHIRFETVHRRKDGTLYDVNVTLQTIKSQNEHVFAAIVEDITDRKSIETQLKNSAATFAKAFHSNPVPTSITELGDGTFYDVNDAWVETIGHARDDVLGKTSLKLGVWATPQDRERFVEKIGEKGQVRDFQANFIDSQGHVRHMLHSAAIIEFDGARRLLTASYDITERLRAEVELKWQQEELRQILRTVPRAVLTCDANGTIRTFNPAAEEMFGYESKQVTGQNIRVLVPAPFATGGNGETGRASTSGAPRIIGPEPRQVVGRRQDGSEFPVELALATIGEPGIAGFVAVAADITEQIEAKKLLVEDRDNLKALVDAATADLKTKADELEVALAKEKQLNELQRQFVSMASHEFRTPLAVIDLAVQRLIRRKNRMSEDDLEKRGKQIRSAVQTMTSLMESTLSAARMDAGTIELNVVECDVRSVLSEACDCQSEFRDDAEISCDIAEQVPDTIVADPSALRQVFTNLLSNALKYSPEGPDITVSAGRDGDHVFVSVQDKGLGMSEQDLEKLFTRFFRAETSIGIPGTGIGLNLTKQLVELHGGTIDVTSEIGAGSTFTVRLPIAGPKVEQNLTAAVTAA